MQLFLLAVPARAAFRLVRPRSAGLGPAEEICTIVVEVHRGEEGVEIGILVDKASAAAAAEKPAEGATATATAGSVSE